MSPPNYYLILVMAGIFHVSSYFDAKTNLFFLALLNSVTPI